MCARFRFVLSFFALLLAVPAFAQGPTGEINAFIDEWHKAASVADEQAYFGAMTADAVFIGTDASERWSRDELREWAKEYFAKDTAWVFEPLERNVTVGPSGETAWFDEKLGSPHMGETRGTGILVIQDGEWKIAHYTLSFAVPNDLADGLVAQIAERNTNEPETINGLPVGRWRAVLESPGGPVPFDLMVEDEGGEIASYFVNADEWIRVPAVTIDEHGIINFDMDLHDSRITATLNADGRSMFGQYTKRKGGFKWDRMVFSAEFTDAPRFAPIAPEKPVINPAFTPIDGRWRVVFDDDRDDPAIGVFETVEGAGGNKVHGTFLTTVGDYRFIEGVYEHGRLRMSVFDAAHCFLFDATVGEDGTMSGSFISGEHYSTTFTATRNDDVELSDPFALTKWTGGEDLGAFTFPDAYGQEWSLDDDSFAGEARIIQVMGTWCPNCRDETNYLIELHNRYADEGLSIVAVSYEVTGDDTRNADIVRTYIERLGIPYPVLIAGGSDGGNKRKAQKAIGFLDKVIAYPTTVFIDGDGTVQAVHTGFMGPATGEKHLELRAEFERIIEGMLED